ncbi:MAG TPA: patatin-like phospholipase family protein [Gemmatimonadota bacterium]|nr:patatin-like phospholipase family protein [Gemmatimonadota bacterium]
MSSALLYQWMFLRLSKRFTLPFLAASAVLFGVAFPPLARRVDAALPPLLAAIAVIALVAVAIVAALWAATAVYRLAPPRPAAWFPGTAPPVIAATPLTASPLGRYDRIGIILAGGGAKGAYQAGSLAAVHGFLERRGALGNVRMVAASSVGAWNACFWLAGMVSEDSGSALERWWSELRLSEVVAPTFYFPAARNFVLSADPWRQAFRKLFADHPPSRDRLESLMHDPDRLRFYLTRTNVERGHLEFSTNRRDLVDVDNHSGVRRPLEPPDRWTRARTLDDLEQAVFASMDLPPLFEHVRIGDETFEDGGVVDNVPIYFGTGIEKCDLLFVLLLNASFASGVGRRWILRRMQRVLTIRQGALERRALKDVYLYNELAALRGRVEAAGRLTGTRRVEPALRSDTPVASPAGSEAAFDESASRSLEERAAGRVHRPVQVFAVCPDEPLGIDTLEFWKTREAGRAFRLMREHTRYELERFDFDAEPNWLRVALVGPSGEVRYLEDF